MYNRAVLHMDLDAFFVSVEQLHNDALRGLPLIIGGTSERGVVASCSYEARRFGVHSAMPIKMALRLCPDAVVLRGDMESYSKHSALVTDIIAEQAPLFEKASIDEFYLDLTGMDRHFGCYKWAVELRQKVMKESGLPISFGLASNKLISKVGTGESKPNGMHQVENGFEKQFLAPLSTRKLPSIGKATYQKLSLMGVRTIDKLAVIPPVLLQHHFGKLGFELSQKANGIDHRPVVPYYEQKSISTERTFQVDTIDIRMLKDKLTEMVIKLAFELREQHKLSACITIKIRYSDFNTFTQQQRIPYTCSDKALIQFAHELFDKLYQRRQMIRLLGVRLSDLVHGHQQMSLFDDTAEESKLLEQLDLIRKRFGDKAVMRATSLQGKKPL